MKRLIAVGVSLSGVAGWTHAAPNYSQMQKRLGVPTSVASVVDASTTGMPELVLIQDIHRHPEAQQQIAAMILYGTKHWGAKEIYLEGSWAEGESLRASKEHLTSLWAAVHAGQMGGAEMAAAMISDPEVRFLGLEDPDLYRSNVAAYEDVDQVRAEALRQLSTHDLVGRVFDSQSGQTWEELKRLIELRMKPAEYAAYLKNPFRPASHSALAEAVQSAEHFYDVANRRSSAFLEKTKKLHRSGLQVLIVGGFHTAAMAETLRREGISFVVLSPHITQGGFDDLYAKGMHDTISALKLH
jgi:hypothetical protein